ncbi:hypothetical protein D1BOALGB6SA_6560 [Olavius sp. associated proteobacterium Delta 1]|nr:hypothetical protein D1BOALGB6SA_6560 [Olavius sp. associated proteobacterium Delta 1]
MLNSYLTLQQKKFYKFHRRAAEVAGGINFSFAYLSKANEKKNYLCALCASAVKKN